MKFGERGSRQAGGEEEKRSSQRGLLDVERSEEEDGEASAAPRSGSSKTHTDNGIIGCRKGEGFLSKGGWAYLHTRTISP